AFGHGPLLRARVVKPGPVRSQKKSPAAGHLTSGRPAPEGSQDSVSVSSDTAVRGCSSAKAPQKADEAIAHGAVGTSAASNECRPRYPKKTLPSRATPSAPPSC